MHVILAIQDPNLRLAIELLLHEEPGLTVVGAASETDGLAFLTRTTSPDLLVVDWELPGRALVAVLAEINAASCPPKIIVLGHQAADQVRAVEAGAHAYVVKGERPELLQAALHGVATRSEPYLQPSKEEGNKNGYSQL